MNLTPVFPDTPTPADLFRFVNEQLPCRIDFLFVREEKLWNRPARELSESWTRYNILRIQITSSTVLDTKQLLLRDQTPEEISRWFWDSVNNLS